MTVTLKYKNTFLLLSLILLLSCNEDIAVNPENELPGTWIESGSDPYQNNGFIIETDSIYAIEHYDKYDTALAAYYVWAKGTWLAIKDTVANINSLSFSMKRLNSPAGYTETYTYTIGNNVLTLTSSTRFLPRILRRSEITLSEVNKTR